MKGFLRGKCPSGDMKVNENSAQYLVHKLSGLQSQNADMTVQLVNVESKCRELAMKNSRLKVALDKPRAYLSWHAIPPTQEEPLLCGEYLDVHDEAGYKSSDGTDYWSVFARPEIETSAIDAFLVKMRAQGVEIFALMFVEEAIKDNNITTGWKARASKATSEYAELLHKGADK